MKFTSYRFGVWGDQRRGLEIRIESSNEAIAFGPSVFVPRFTLRSPNLPVIVTRWPRLVTLRRLMFMRTVESHVPHESSGRTWTRWKSTVSSFLR